MSFWLSQMTYYLHSTRMHSRRMRTVRYSSRLLGGCLLLGVGGVCSQGSGGACSWGDVCSRGCLLLGGVCSWGVPAPWGVSAPRGCLVSTPRGVVASQHALRQAPREQTDRCKNITFATSLRTVIKNIKGLLKQS